MKLLVISSNYIIGNNILNMKKSQLRQLINEVLKEGKITVKNNKYLVFHDGELSSIPTEQDDQAIVFDNNKESAKVYRNRNGLYLDTNKYDMSFSNLDELVKYLNKNNFRYIGIDDI